MAVNKDFLDILCCPAVNGGAACRGDLVELEDELQCKTCGLRYPIVDGIPELLAGEAKN